MKIKTEGSVFSMSRKFSGCLFVHDFRSYEKNGIMYSVNMSYDMFRERYTKYFGAVRVLNRCGKIAIEDAVDRYVISSGEGVEFVNAIDVFSPLSYALNHIKIKKTVDHYVDESEYVIVRLDSFLGLAAAKRCRETGKKYLVEVVGCVWDSFWNKGAWGKIVAYPLLKKMQREIKYAPYVVYVTEQFLQNRYPTRGINTNISNVLLPRHDDDLLKRRLERIESSEESQYQIVTVASVSVKYKGQETVIRALGELKKQGNNNLIYHLIGGGDQSYLRTVARKVGVENQVIFHGGMNHDDVMAFLDNCDIYIQPSKQEGLPRALIEGMSKGMLCFGTNVAGIPELLDKEMMFSKNSNNYLEVADLLRRITKKEYIEQSKRNFIKAQKYEIEVLARRRDDFFGNFRDA